MKKIFSFIIMVAAITIIGCADAATKISDPTDYTQLKEFYDTYSTEFSTYSISSLGELDTRLSFYDKWSSVIGTKTVAEVATAIGARTSDVTSLQSTIASLQSQVVNMQSNIDTLQSTIASLQAAGGDNLDTIASLQTSIVSLQGQITTLNNSVTSLNNQVSTLTSGNTADDATIASLTDQVSTLQDQINNPEYDEYAADVYMFVGGVNRYTFTNQDITIIGVSSNTIVNATIEPNPYNPKQVFLHGIGYAIVYYTVTTDTYIHCMIINCTTINNDI